MTPSQRVSAVFAEQFEQQPDLLVRAPGRVNLIGEHTDYNDGFVLPCAIDYETCVAIGLRSDNLVHVIAADYGNQRDLFDLDSPSPIIRTSAGATTFAAWSSICKPVAMPCAASIWWSQATCRGPACRRPRLLRWP